MPTMVAMAPAGVASVSVVPAGVNVSGTYQKEKNGSAVGREKPRIQCRHGSDSRVDRRFMEEGGDKSSRLPLRTAKQLPLAYNEYGTLPPRQDKQLGASLRPRGLVRESAGHATIRLTKSQGR